MPPVPFFQYLIRTMIPQSLFITYVAILSIFSMSEASKSTIGFTIDLIHRDSPQSPTYNSSLSPSQRLANAIQRSYNRLHHFNIKCNRKSPVAEVTGYDGEYLMTYLIGTPPVPSIGSLDTGSDLTWTQCAPCTNCIKQKLPLFNPKKSQTYKTVPCNSNKCSPIEDGTCDMYKRKCLYSYSYADNSSTYGDLATDTLTLGSTTGKIVSFPDFALGCGFNNSGIFGGVESGIVGLGGGSISLVSQLGSSIQGKFSYCLIPYNSNTTDSSKLHFGNNARVSGTGVVSTPLVVNKFFPKTFYVVILEGISVGNHRLEINGNLSGFSNNSRPDNEGNMIVDSGTTLTLLPPHIYRKLEKKLKRFVKLKRNPDPQLDGLCWFTKTDDRIPRITMHFKGADVILHTENAFYRTSSDTLCSSFVPVDAPFAVYGNLAQQNFLVGYDLLNKKLSFKRKDCAEF